MTWPRTTTRSAATLLVAAAYLALTAVAVGCSGGNDTTTSTSPVAKFTPDTAAPVAGTIALLAGSSSGASINVRVTVTGVPSFFGAAFRLTYDPAALLFNGMVDSGSLLRQGVTDDDVLFMSDASNVPGEILITATRIDPTGAPPLSVVATSDLVVVNFIARKSIAVAAEEGRVEFGDPKQVCDGTVTPPGCGAVTVTWSGGGLSAK